MYQLKMKRNQFLKHQDNIEYSNITIKEDYVLLNTNSLEFNCDFDIIKDYKKERFVFFKKKILFISGVILFISCLIFNSSIIKNIKFDSLVDEDVYDYVEHHIDSGFLNTSIYELNHNIKQVFPEYEWISVERVGNNLLINLKEAPNYNKVILNNKEGDFYASKEGVIKFFYIQKGKVLVEYNQYVEEGELLVSGNLLYEKELETSDEIKEEYVSPRGIVIAETFSVVKEVVYKKNVDDYYTGKVLNDKVVSLFGFDFTNFKHNMNNYETQHNTLFNFFNIFSVTEMKYKEKNAIIKEYDKIEATEYAKDKIKYDFYSEQRDANEDIIDLELLSISDQTDKYELTFLVKAQENITEFRKR